MVLLPGACAFYSGHVSPFVGPSWFTASLPRSSLCYFSICPILVNFEAEERDLTDNEFVRRLFFVDLF